jgi:hypothetical protein
MSLSFKQFFPPQMADFQSVSAAFSKKDAEVSESLYLQDQKKFFRAEGLSAEFKMAVIRRSTVRVVTNVLTAKSVPMKNLY